MLLDNLQYGHWLIVGFGFGVWSAVARVRWLNAPCLAGLAVGLVAYGLPEIHWAWQVWGFVMVSVLGAIVYLRREQAPVQATINETAAALVQAASGMIGKWAILQEPLPRGQSKIPIEGRYWQVFTPIRLEPGSRVLVTSHKGPVLQISCQDSVAHRDDEGAETGQVSLAEFQRSAEADMLFGAPDFDFWALFDESQAHHSKLALVYAYHLIAHLRGFDLEAARSSLNTYTLALYDASRRGQLLQLQPRLFSEPRTYSFLYGESRWPGSRLERFEQDMDALAAALCSPWAEVFMDAVKLEHALAALADVRERQYAVMN